MRQPNSGLPKATSRRLSARRPRLLCVVRTAHARPDTGGNTQRTTAAPPASAIPASPTPTPRRARGRAADRQRARGMAQRAVRARQAAETAQEIVAASAQGPDRSGQIQETRRRISAARRELDRCRAALRDAGSEPARREILTWLDEAAAEKEQADAALERAMELAPPALSVDEVRCGRGAVRRTRRSAQARPPTPNAPRCTPRWESAPSTTQNATKSDSGWTPLLQQRVGGGT